MWHCRALRCLSAQITLQEYSAMINVSARKKNRGTTICWYLDGWRIGHKGCQLVSCMFIWDLYFETPLQIRTTKNHQLPFCNTYSPSNQHLPELDLRATLWGRGSKRAMHFLNLRYWKKGGHYNPSNKKKFLGLRFSPYIKKKMYMFPSKVLQERLRDTRHLTQKQYMLSTVKLLHFEH